MGKFTLREWTSSIRIKGEDFKDLALVLEQLWGSSCIFLLEPDLLGVTRQCLRNATLSCTESTPSWAWSTTPTLHFLPMQFYWLPCGSAGEEYSTSESQIHFQVTLVCPTATNISLALAYLMQFYSRTMNLSLDRWMKHVLKPVHYLFVYIMASK